MDDGPRIAPLGEGEWDDFLSRVLAASPGGTEEPMAIFATLGRHQDLFKRWIGFGGALLGGLLTARVRELVIMRTAFNCASEYEWTHHVRLARAAGINDEEIASLSEPLDSVGWAGSERAVLAAADEIHRDGALSNRTWSDLAVAFDERQLIELLMLIGQYHMVAWTLRALRVPLESSAHPDVAAAEGPVAWAAQL